MSEEEINVDIMSSEELEDFEYLIQNYSKSKLAYKIIKIEEESKSYYNANFELQQENKLLKEENKDLKRAEEKVEYLKEQKENKNKWFQLIADIGYDYDGCNTIESLKGLIDELTQYALNGRDNEDFNTLIFEGDSNA